MRGFAISNGTLRPATAISPLSTSPKTEDLEILFLMATEFMVVALEAIASILSPGLGAVCDEWKRTLSAFGVVSVN